MNFMLILTVVTMNGTAIESIPYSSKEACEIAGVQWVETLPQRRRVREWSSFSCIEVR